MTPDHAAAQLERFAQLGRTRVAHLDGYRLSENPTCEIPAEVTVAKVVETLRAAEATLDAARLQLRGDSEQVYQLQSTLKEVEGAAAALREFFDYLERNPEALIKGKQP